MVMYRPHAIPRRQLWWPEHTHNPLPGFCPKLPDLQTNPGPSSPSKLPETGATLHRSPSRSRPATLADFTDDLLWVKLMRAPALALRPERLVVCLFGVILILACLRLPGIFISSEGSPLNTFIEFEKEALRELVSGIKRFHSGDIVAGIWKFVFSGPRQTVSDAPLSAAIMFIPSILIFCLVGGAVSRMVACEFSQGTKMPWDKALMFSLSRLTSSVLALLMPLIVVVGLGALISLFGWTLGIAGANLVGALAYGIALIFAALAVVAIGTYLIGWPMLIPAIACEGTDAVDATQRAVAYVLGRPLRLFLYSVFLMAQAAVATLICAVVVAGVEGFIAHASAQFAGDAAKQVASGDAGSLGWSFKGAAWIVSQWHMALSLIVSAFVLCLHFSGSTIRYLLLRRINDGQELEEIWMPKMIPGTSAPVDPADGENED